MKYTNQSALTPEEQQALEAVATRLNAVVRDSVVQLVRDAVFKPAPGSHIETANMTDLRDAYEQAGMSILAAEDHLRTILVVVKTGPLPSFALYTLLRAAAVGDIHAKYLLDPTIDEPSRLGRGLSARLRNLEEQRKVRGDGQEDHFQERVAHLERRAKTNDITVLQSRTGTTIGFGEGWRSDTDLFTGFMPGGTTLFQFLSGNAHSWPWAILAINKAQPTDDPNVKLALADLNVILFAAMLNGVLDLHEQNLLSWFAHAGFPSQVLKDAIAQPSA